MGVMVKTIEVRLASESDSCSIFEWRNDKHTRLMSHTSDRVEWHQHQVWFKNSLKMDSRILLICENDSNELIAFVRFDISQSSALMSINLNPNMRGKGFAKPCLNSAIKFLTSKFELIHTLIAEVKEENIASSRAFLGVGFNKIKVENNVGFYKKDLVKA